MESLYRLCVCKTATLLKSQFWTGFSEDHDPVNHFIDMPSTIVDDLFTCIVDELPEPQVSDLHLLVTSGRLRNFRLEHILMTKEEFVTMLMSLSSASKELRTLIFRRLAFSNPYPIDPIKKHLISGTIECLVRMSPKLEVLESCIEFDLKAIRNSEHLKVLKVNFVAETSLTNFLVVEDEFWPNNSINVIEVYQDIRHPVKYIECVNILKYCKALTSINIDISCCLEYMHMEELNDGTLDTVYQLQKCYLGSECYGPATITEVHIATLTCPYMKEVDILVCDNHVVYGLRDFENLESLLVQWESPNGGNFQLGMQMLIEVIGPKLTTLHLLNFLYVDFAVIGLYLPALVELKVEYLSEHSADQRSTDCFHNLKKLILENTDLNISVSENTLLLLLSHCLQLTHLSLLPATCLNDNLLAKILEKNSLCNVQELVLDDCALSEVGVRQLATSFKSLTVFDLKSSEVEFEDAADIVHAVNSGIIMVEI